MGLKYLNEGEKPTKLPKKYLVTTKHPFDVRDSVETFNDLLDVFGTFSYYVYEDMCVKVSDEGCVYQLISRPDAPTGDRGSNIGNQFYEEEDQLYKNKDLWKRLNTETITTKAALKRAKSNLVNGALIYIANDITLDDGTTQKSGFYFCKNVDGEGKLTLAGGSEVVNSLESDSESAALSAAMGNALNNSINDLNDSINDLKEYKEMSIDFGKYEDSVTIAIMQPSIIAGVKLVNVSKLLLSYKNQMRQEYTSGEIDLGDSDYLVLEVTRGTDATTAVVGLTLKNK